MRGTVVAATFILLLFLSGIEGKSLTKRHTQFSLDMIPNAIGLYIYHGVNYVSPEAANYLKEKYESEPVQKARKVVTEATVRVVKKIQDGYSKVYNYFQKTEEENQEKNR